MTRTLLSKTLWPLTCFAVLALALAAGVVAQEKQPDPNEEFLRAAFDGNVPELEKFLASGTDVNAAHLKTGGTALMFAAIKNRVEAARLLLSKGADVNVTAKDGNTALVLAVRDGHTGVAQMLLAKGADVNTKDRTAHDSTPLHHAVINHHLAAARLLISKGADVNARASGGWPLIISAASKGTRELVELLLDKGADANAQDESFTALSLATSWNNLPVVELLLTRGANPNARLLHGQTVLMEENQKPEIAKLLIARGADVNATDEDGNTALIRGVNSQPVEYLQALLDAKANPNLTNKEGETALLKLFTDYDGKPRAEVVRLLLARGADASIRSSDGFDALYWAIVQEETGIEEMIAARVDSRRRRESLNMALITSSYGPDKALTVKLLARGADPNTVALTTTPLVAAAKNGSAEIVRLLLDKGAKPGSTGVYFNSAQPRRGTALEAAEFWGYYEVISLLRKTASAPLVKR